MSRATRTWLWFALCLTLALGGLAWITQTTLQLDRIQREAEQQAIVQENARLALWRMDSAVLPILMEENARPYFQYSPQYRVVRGDKDSNALSQELDTVLNLSPLVEQDVPLRCVYFQVDPQGNVISPQLPGVVNRTVDTTSPANTNPAMNKQVQRLNELQDTAQLQSVGSAIPDDSTNQTDAQSDAGTPPQPPTPAQNHPVYSGKGEIYQNQLNDSDLKARQEMARNSALTNRPSFWSSNPPDDLNADNSQPSQPGQGPANGSQYLVADQSSQAPTPQMEAQGGQAPPNRASNSPTQTQSADDAQVYMVLPVQATPGASPAPIYADNNWLQPISGARDPAVVGTMTPLWRNSRLLLTRKVTVAHEEFVQGVWLDWPALQRKLLDEVHPLLPNAQVEPMLAAENSAAVATAEGMHPHQMALLPVQLIPGSVPFAAPKGFSPVERTLLIAWLAIVVAALAAGALLFGVMALSERRAAFVSAVTHELRTPLTTFRMYTEMLGAGMVRDEAKKTKYLATMRAEAVRLGHLVENVLAYAQLERGGHRNPHAGRMDSIALGDLLARIEPHLFERAEQAGMRLTIQPGSPNTQTHQLRTDPTAVEQILFNLVDNACKYGRSTGASGADAAEQGRIDLTAVLQDRQLRLTVRDHGSGIPADQQKCLFEPFSRSAEIAANSATRTPGVGLGLALCRRMARALGGDIRWNSQIRDGAAFDLLLPIDPVGCKTTTAEAAKRSATNEGAHRPA